MGISVGYTDAVGKRIWLIKPCILIKEAKQSNTYLTILIKLQIFKAEPARVGCLLFHCWLNMQPGDKTCLLLHMLGRLRWGKMCYLPSFSKDLYDNSSAFSLHPLTQYFKIPSQQPNKELVLVLPDGVNGINYCYWQASPTPQVQSNICHPRFILYCFTEDVHGLKLTHTLCKAS